MNYMKKILYSLLFMKKKMNYNFKIQKTFLKKINIPYRKEKKLTISSSFVARKRSINIINNVFLIKR